MATRYVVVGASLAGLNAVETFRAEGFDGTITLLEAEEHVPYDRPPLSKQVLQTSQPASDFALRTEAEWAALNVELHLGSTATDLDLDQRCVLLHGGQKIDYDGLVIATGARCRTLPGTPIGLAGVHTLRTVEDALAVRAAFDAGARVVVVGAGFIGAEVAASGRRRGLQVTVLEASEVPLGRTLGEDMGAACAVLHTQEGVDVRCGVTVASFEGSDRVERVLLADGSAVDADVVIVGVGVAPNTEWLQSSGLALDDGILCDQWCAASAPGVYAAGDVARWYHPQAGEHVRVEHWTNAAEQGAAAAQNLLAGPGAGTPYAPTPYFWSDQYDTRIQFAGLRHPDDEVHVVHGSIEEQQFVAIYGRHGRLTAALAFGLPREFMKYRRLLTRGGSWDEAMHRAGQPA